VKQLEVADDVHEQVTLLARAWNASASDALRRLLAEFRGAGEPSVSPVSAAEQEAVYAIYGGTRTDGFYDRVSHSLTITTGPLASRTFSKPSGAAVALVQVYSPDVNPNRNGWSFWVVSKTGKRLQTIRYEHPRMS
jgi:negative regulator of replication initiation